MEVLMQSVLYFQCALSQCSRLVLYVVRSFGYTWSLSSLTLPIVTRTVGDTSFTDTPFPDSLCRLIS